ncbi:MAG: 30S ribosomal protein S15 [Omnitrophica bacterium RIFCSPHIGHO2_02_FULL_49_9]|nr:MAG: 30S ribosomal protein S15 [Omnitrophica bacterium RIFCSPHIGHO2_02_FULL_49_9]
MPTSKENKSTVVKQFRRNQLDTGSAEVQIALLTARINELTQHVQAHKKDKHSRHGLIQMVENRKRLLKYLERERPEPYKKLITELKLRK